MGGSHRPALWNFLAILLGGEGVMVGMEVEEELVVVEVLVWGA